MQQRFRPSSTSERQKWASE